LVERYLHAKKSVWARKTYENRTQQLRLLIDHLGVDTVAATITPGDLREFRDGLKRLRLNHHTGPGKSFTARQTEAEDRRIAPKTAALLFETAKALFRWAKLDGYLADNPAQDIPNEVIKSPKAKRSRRPFTEAELTAIFTAPVYVGAKSLRRRFQPGGAVKRDAYFWIPLIAFFTGMRLGEIVQLHIGDLHLAGEIPFIDVSWVNDGQAGSSEDKHLKSAAAVRQVPLHPDLMALGFAQFVTQRAKMRKNAGRLFFEVRYGADGVPSTVFSKWFARFLDKLGLTDPTIVFHSFRHSAEDAFRNAALPQYQIDRIIGHSDDSTSAGYGEGISLDTAYAAVKAMKLKADLPALWKRAG
jgi:integrase